MNFFIFDDSVGTIIDQGEAPDFYFQKYPEDNPILGFFTWKWIFALGFDHMFSSPLFLSLLVLLAASLMACTYTTQIPLVKVARRSGLSASYYRFELQVTWTCFNQQELRFLVCICRWSFVHSAEAISKQEIAETLPRASVQDLGVILMGAGYEVCDI